MLQAEDGIRDVAVTGVQTCVPSRRRHTRCSGDWSSDVCASDLCVCVCVCVILQCVCVCVCIYARRRIHIGVCVCVDRKSVVEGKSGDLGGRRMIKKKRGERAERKRRRGWSRRE